MTYAQPIAATVMAHIPALMSFRWKKFCGRNRDNNNNRHNFLDDVQFDDSEIRKAACGMKPESP